MSETMFHVNKVTLARLKYFNQVLLKKGEVVSDVNVSKIVYSDNSLGELSLNTSSGMLQVDMQNDSKDVNRNKDQNGNGQFDDAQSSDSGGRDLNVNTDNHNGDASLKGKNQFELPTTDTSPVAIATDEHYTDQISLAGNILQTTISSISDMTMSSLNHSQNKINKGEKSHQHVHMLTPEKKKEIYDEQYHIMK